MANPEHLEILKQGVDVWNKWRKDNFKIKADLSEANLSEANLSKAYLSKANLFLAHLSVANLRRADLSGADFSEASLFMANLSEATFLYNIFSNTILFKTNFNNSRVGSANFGNVDLSTALNLDTVNHVYPSTIGIDTIYRSGGNIPEVFLLNAGVPQEFIDYISSFVGKPWEYYSCFISYSSNDQEIAGRLYADLQREGVRCWLATEDLDIGDRHHKMIDQAIKLYDKLIVILSETSVESEWVEDEVLTALDKEEPGGQVLFPVRIDDAIMETDQPWAAKIKRKRHIGDFCKWKDHDQYKKTFDLLLRALKPKPETK